MTSSFPYALVSCPCEAQVDFAAAALQGRRSTLPIRVEDDDDVEDKTLNPHGIRANFSLYPYDRLLYCDECHQIKCPRCWAEEVTHWYCPMCHFQVPSSIVKNDGKRCTRSCYSCPLCTASLSVNALDQQVQALEGSGASGTFFLYCAQCEWSSLDVGIKLGKPHKVTEQLQKLRQPGRESPREDTVTEQRTSEDSIATQNPSRGRDDETKLPEQQFAQLLKFYKTQLSESDVAANNPYGLDASYSSPSNLARIMQIYGGLSASSLKKAKEKPQPMREALHQEEGIITFSPAFSPDSSSQLAPITQPASINQTATAAQRASHPWNHYARLQSDLWPVPALLRTKVSKRCRTCRHILIRLDDARAKSSSSSSTASTISAGKYKIRLLAQNNIPRLSLRPFSPTNYTSAPTSFPRPNFALTSTALKSLSATSCGIGDLYPGKTKQLLLLISNPLFEKVRISLASPQVTPGKVQSRVTILCPTFEIGADGDMWDSALDLGASVSSAPRGAGGGKRSETLAGGAGQVKEAKKDGEERVPEAGKVWERGRNWVGVVVEVVPGTLSHADHSGEVQGKREPEDEEEDYDDWVKRQRREKMEMTINDHVLEIPILVKAEWEADVAGEEGGVTPNSGKTAREKRDIGFWCVLGAGRILP